MTDRKTPISPMLRPIRISARWLAALMLFGVICALYATLIEPHWIRIKKLNLTENPSLTIAHITDIHYKGDEAYLRKAVKKINRQHPDLAMRLTEAHYDLILAGHSHGGQVRIPLYGSLLRMTGAKSYERGLYKTDAGPLYVNPGLGTYLMDIRFLCRPEITVIRL